MVANIIGTGVFTSLGFQLPDIHSGFALLMLWIVGGIAALCGALCYGELSAALPRSGGEYHFLSRIYHPAIGFMAGVVSATIGFAAPIALAAMAFGKYFKGVFDFGSPVFLSFAVVWLVALFHLGNLRVGSAFQNLWTVLKLLLIATLIGAGLFVQPKEAISFLPAPSDMISIFDAPLTQAICCRRGDRAADVVVRRYGTARHPDQGHSLTSHRRPQESDISPRLEDRARSRS